MSYVYEDNGPAVRWLLRQPKGFHIAATCFSTGTAAHLPDHAIEATEDRKENLRLHLEAHRLDAAGC